MQFLHLQAQQERGNRGQESRGEGRKEEHRWVCALGPSASAVVVLHTLRVDAASEVAWRTRNRIGEKSPGNRQREREGSVLL